MAKEKAADVASVKRQGDDTNIIPAESQTPKEATYVSFPLACLRSDYPLEEIPPADARRIFQRCLAWHIVTAKVEPRFFSDLIDDVSAIEALAADVATNYGKQRALFPVTLFRSAMNDWSYRKFAILAAVYASVGQSEYRVVVRDKITAGSVGFSNQEEREAFGSTFEPITVNKLRTTLEQLQTSRLIVSARYNGRTTAYGRVKSNISLADKIKKRRGEKNNGDTFFEDFQKMHERVTANLEVPRNMDASAVKPQESSAERDARLARESLAREEASNRRNLHLYPTKGEQPKPVVARPPKDPPTREEVEAKRQEINRLASE
jgi:hypothetical protein